MPRLAVGAKQDYLYQVTAHPEIQQLQSTFLARVEKVVEKAREKQEQYGGSACCIDFTNVTLGEYAYLWLDSRTQHLHYFLNYSRQLSQVELDKSVSVPLLVCITTTYCVDWRRARPLSAK